MKKLINGQLVDMDAADAADVQAAWDAWIAGKPARDAEAARVGGIDADIAADADVTNAKAMTVTQLVNYWNGRTAAQKDALMRRMFVVMVRRVL